VVLQSEFQRAYELILLSDDPGSLQLTASCLTTQTRNQSYFKMAVYRQLVRLGDKPLEFHDQQYLFSTLAVIVFK
jgi:hypothetical protein